MGTVKYKPTSPGRRASSVNDFSELTDKRKRPEKSLCERLRKHAGRNHHGRITARHRGGGARRIYRRIDFKRTKDGIPATVKAIEYDPNRTCHIALVEYADGEKRYILAPVGLKAGDVVESGFGVEPKVGNAMPLKRMPPGMDVHNVELNIGQGGKLARSAGTSARLISRDGDWAILLLRSGEMREVRAECRATVGQLGNVDHKNEKLGKAGATRWRGRRPVVRGSAMTPRDHPHGGGEGRAPLGMNPKTPWGKPALGFKTRKRTVADKFIVRRRK